jgi:hypothetical protein
MKVVTPRLRVRVGVNFEARGFHNSLCERKYRIPWIASADIRLVMVLSSLPSEDRGMPVT